MLRTLLVVLLMCTTASADDASPWAVGVSIETQQRANALFAEGNQLFAQQAHAIAIDKYKAALELWDHPLIRFNLAVTLIRVGKLVEASDALDRALRYGNQPFDATQYQQARDYQVMLDKRIVVERRPSRVRAAWIAGGVGVALSVGGITMGYVASRQYRREFDNGNCIDADPPSCNAEGFANTRNARTLGTVGTVVGITGALLVVGGGVLYFTAPHERVVVAVAPTSDGIAAHAIASF